MAATPVQCPTCFARVPAGVDTCPSCEATLQVAVPPPARAVRMPRHAPDKHAHGRRTAPRDTPRRRRAGPLTVVGGVLAALTLAGGAAGLVILMAQPTAVRPAATANTPSRPVEVPPQDEDPDRPFPFPPDDDEPAPRRPGPKFAAVVPFELKPAALSADTVQLELPGKVVNACAGGGGRFIILHLDGVKQLAVVDVTLVKVVKSLPLASDDVLFAAGMNKLVVAYPEANTLERYDLTTFEKEATAKNPFDGRLLRLAMGSASAGPLAVAVPVFGHDSKLVFLDPATLTPADINAGGGWGYSAWATKGPVRAAPDGRVFTVQGDGPQSFVVRGGAGKWHERRQNLGPAVPGPDGLLYTSDGAFTADFDRRFRLGTDDRERHVLPAVEGPMDLELLARVGRQVPDEPTPAAAEVRMVGDERVLVRFPNIGRLNTHRGAKGMPVDRRVYLVPSAEVLVVIPEADDTLVFRRFDVTAGLKASGQKHLLVTSRPPPAVPGGRYEYRVVARSSGGGVTFKLYAGPSGMAVSDDGAVTWAVPRAFAGAERVLVGVSDADGQEAFHSFELTCRDGKPTVGPVGGGGPSDNPRPPAPKGGLVVAPSRVFEVTPRPRQPENVSVELPGRADATCVGGGGRFLVYRVPTAKQLAVVDVVIGRVVKLVPMPDPDAPFAVGMTKLFVLTPSAGVLQRYDLETFEREAVGLNPLSGEPRVLLMGHATDGPLFVGGRGVGGAKGYGFVNPATLGEWPLPMDWELRAKKDEFHPLGPNVAAPRFSGEAIGLRVSADGRTFAWSDYLGKGSVMTIGERSARVRTGSDDALFQRPTPGPDGTLFGRFGLHSPDLKPLRGKPEPLATFVPAARGPWYLSVVDPDSWGQNGEMPPIMNQYPKTSVSVGTTADQTIRFPLPQLAGTTGSKSARLDERLHLIPEAHTLAALTHTRDTVHLHRLSIKELMGQADKDALLVASTAPPAARGAKWAYTPEVWSKKGGVKWKLESGPDGMTASGGTLTWDVPAAVAESEVPVLLSVRDAGGQEGFHSFTLPVRAAGAAVVVIRPPLP